ncbi:hypothetical protein ASF61_06030 [Duganella sp. Leaf126]|uniref:PulJ/GspJ family protein n=1 Tax=Duganella sp. Leaf126 TaxID=1736266 RepID=UPI0006FB9989|nr:prepilin-type N-terminal cleavage/methylation domain-containing protein [Duganella sp. Leaf126]KQQ40326.1 hypothetical protein ASF61_06030 [Duganella sp. Leaf126]
MTGGRVRVHRAARGFTLVEAIVAIVLTAIIAGTMVLFIKRPVANYIDSAGRAEMSDVADLALRRMAREIRASLPNSARAQFTASDGAWYLEFIPTFGGGRYLSVEDNTVSGTPLSFTDPAAASFSVVGAAAAMTPAGPNYIAIYNLGAGFQDADAYAAGNLARVTGSSMASGLQTIAYASVAAADLGGGNTVSPVANPFAAPANAATPRPPNTSPDQRFQVVGKPVVFRCAGNASGTGTLTRSVAPVFSPVPTTPAAGAGVLLANNVVACALSVAGNANRQSALVGLTLTLGRTGSDGRLETVTLTHQINVNNLP